MRMRISQGVMQQVNNAWYARQYHNAKWYADKRSTYFFSFFFFKLGQTTTVQKPNEKVSWAFPLSNLNRRRHFSYFKLNFIPFCFFLGIWWQVHACNRVKFTLHHKRSKCGWYELFTRHKVVLFHIYLFSRRCCTKRGSLESMKLWTW